MLIKRVYLSILIYNQIETAILIFDSLAFSLTIWEKHNVFHIVDHRHSIEYQRS